MYRIEIDRSLCSGFGSCAEHAPGSIRIDTDGLGDPTGTEPDGSVALEAAASCPMGAIAVYNHAGERLA